MTRDLRDYVKDILDAAGKSVDFVEGMTFEEFSHDDKTVYAVVRALEVVGEAVKNLPGEYKAKYLTIPWKDLAGMRDKLIHSYFGVDLKRVWLTVTEDIPLLRPEFERMAREAGIDE